MSAAQEQENYAKSIQYSIDRLSASLQELAADFLDSGLVKGAIETLNSIVRGVDSLIDSIGSLGTLAGAGAIGLIIKQIIELNKVIQAVELTTKSLSGAEAVQGVANALQGLNAAQAVSIVTMTAMSEEDKVATLVKLGLITVQDQQKFSTDQLTYAEIAKTAAEEADTVATTGLTIASTRLLTVFKALIKNPWALVLAGIIGIVVAAKEAYDYFNVTLDEQKGKLEEVNSEYEDMISELEDLEEQLDSVNEQIKEYESITAPTLVESEELKKLKEEAEYLERAVEAQETLNRSKNKETIQTLTDVFNKEFDNDYDSYDEWYKNNVQNNPNVEENGIIEGWRSFDDVYAVMAEKNIIQKRIAEIEESYDSMTEQQQKEYDGILSSYEQYLDEIDTFLNEQYLSLDSYRDEFESLESDEELETDETYQKVIQMLSEVYSAINPAQYNTDIIDNLLSDTENQWYSTIQSIKKTGLTSVVSDDFIDYINSLDLALEDGQTAMQVFMQQLYAVSQAEIETTSTTEQLTKELTDWLESSVDSDNTVQDTIDDFENNLSTIQSLLESYKSGEENLTVGSALNQLPELQPYIEQYENLGEAIRHYATDAYSELLETLGDTSNVEGATEYIAGLEQQLNEALGSNYHVDTLVDSYEELVQIYKDVQAGTVYTAEQIAALIVKHEALEDAVIETADGYSIEEDALIDLVNDYVSSANTAISTQIEWTKEQINASKQRITAFGLEIQVLKQLANIYSHAGSTEATNYAASLGGKDSYIAQTLLNNGAMDDVLESIDEYDTLLEQYDTLLEQLDESISVGTTFKELADSSSSSADDTEDTYDEIFDYFERRITVLNDALELLSANLENVVGSSAKNSLLASQKELYEEELNNYEDAAAMYQEMANIALSKLSDDVAAKIVEGSVTLEEFVGEENEDVIEAIEDYEEWAEKVADCEQQLAELKETLRQLELEMFNNIVEDFTNQFDLRQNSIDLIDKQIELLETAGELIGESFYTTQRELTEKQLAILEEEQEALVAQLTSALESGYVEKGSEEWLEMISQLNDLESQIYDCETALEEFDNEILALHTEVFERIEGYFEDIRSEIDDLVDLMGDEDVATTDNVWTDDGLTKLALYASQYEAARKQVEDYAEEIEQLAEDYAAGKYSATEYADNLAELTSAQREAAKAAESSLDAIMELNEARVEIVVEGIQEEIDAYKELTDAMIDALEEEQLLHNYEKSIKESTDTISSLQKQIAALEGDTTAAAIAKKKKLQEELAEAQAELEEKEYEHSIETQKDALEQQYEDYEEARNDEIEALQETLENEEQIYADSFAAVKANAETVAQELETLALEHGITISTTLTEAWESGSDAIADYGTVLSSESSVFVSELETIEEETWELQEQANSTSETLSEMFSTQSDTLVSELTEAYDSSENLNTAAQAIQDSFVNALERGYDISTILNNLNSVKSAAEAASAAVSSVGSGGNTTTTTPTTETLSGKLYQWDDDEDGYRYVGTGTVTLPLNSGYYTVGEGDDKRIYYYAKGVHDLDKDELAWTQELGEEAILSPTRNAILTPLNAGDSVLTSDMTNTLWEFAQNPSGFLSNLQVASDIPSVNSTGNALTIGNVLTVNGNIDKDNLEEIKQYTTRAINAAFTKLNAGLH